MNASQLHQSSIVIDGHCDSLLLYQMQESKSWPGAAPAVPERGQVDLPFLREGGVTAQNFACYVPPRYLPAQAAQQTIAMIDLFYRLQADHADELCLATSAADILEAKKHDMVAGILSLEGAEGLQGELALLRTVYRLGVRWIGLTWNHRNQAADGLNEVRSGGGLTQFGVRLIEEMNQLGMVVDIAHLAPAGVRDVFQVCEAPVVASHANAHALCPVPRNLSDEQLTQLAATGGVVGVTYVPDFITTGDQTATLDMLLDNVDHIVRVAGIDHVGLGSDFDGFFDAPPAGLENASCLPNLTAALLQRGYNEDAVCKILGQNWLRVLGEVLG